MKTYYFMLSRDLSNVAITPSVGSEGRWMSAAGHHPQQS